MRVKVFAKRWYLILFLVVGLAILGTGITILLSSDVKSFIFERPPSTARVITVIDGDTIEIENGNVVRLIGIDAPERGEPFFHESRYELIRLVHYSIVRLERDKENKDKYGRLLRYVWRSARITGDELFVNAEMVKWGYAEAYPYPPNTKYADVFDGYEMNARFLERGLWEKEEKTASTYVPTYRPQLFETKKPVEFSGFGTEEELQLSTEEVLEVSMAYSEYLQTLNAWEQAKIDYAAGTGTYGRCYITYQNMLQAKQKYERLKAGTDEFRGFEGLRK